MPATRVRKESTPEKPRQEIEVEAEIDIETPEIVEKTSEKILNRPMGRSIGTPIKVPLSKSSDTSTPTGSPWMTAKSNTPQEGSPPIASNLTKQLHVEKPVITRSKTDSRDGRTPIRAGGVDVGGYGGWDRNDDVDVPRKDGSDTDPDEGMADDDDGRTDEVPAEDEPSPRGAGFEEYPEDEVEEEELLPCMLCKREFPESSMKILLQKKFCQPCVTRILKAQQDRKIKQQQQQPQNQHSPQPQQQRHPSPAFLPQQQQPQQTPQRTKLQHSGGHSHSAQASPMIRNPRPIGTFGMDGGGDFQQGHAMYSGGNDDDYNLQVDFGISTPIPPTSTPATSHLTPEEEADALMGEFRRGYYK